MNKRFLPLLILLIALLACSTTEPGAISIPNVDQTQATAVPTATIPLTVQPTSTPLPTIAPTFTPLPPTPTPDPLIQIGEEVYILPNATPPPSDYLDVYTLKLASGEWTAEQGLTTLLKLFLGEMTSEEALGNAQPQNPEIGGIIALASEYLATGTDPTAKEEIQRLLDSLLPTPARLLPYAQPQPQSPSFKPGSVALASFHPSLHTYQDAMCEELSSRGFPPGGSTICIQYTTATLINGTGTVYYPITWWPNDPNLAYVLTATEAMVRSAQVYAQFGQTASVDIVFGLNNAGGSNPPLAVAPFDHQENCLIVIYPAALAEGKKQGMGYFQQIIAHEMFHCFQHWNVPAMQQSGYVANRWWIEGTAEYFSNVVYPTNNGEWEYIPQFDRDSASKTLIEMDYANTVFFQYLQNVIGDPAIVDFLKSIPPSTGSQASADALAAYPDMQAIFHNFAQAWADKQIVDSGGDFLPNKLIIAESESTDISGDITIYTSTRPFLLSRYFLRFMKENTYFVTSNFSGADGLETARPADMPLAWANLPSTVSAGCETTPFIFLTTSAMPGTDKRLGDLNITHEEDLTCDLCLIGAWQLDTEQFANDFIASLQQDDDMQFKLDSAKGGLTLFFFRHGIYQGIFDNMKISFFNLTTDLSGGVFGLPTIFQHAGQSYGTYKTDGNTLTVFNAFSTVLMQLSIGSQTGEPKPQDGVGFGAGDGVAYTCSETELVFTASGAGTPIRASYDRLSK